MVRGDGKDNSSKIGKPFSYDNEFESLPVKSLLTWTFDGEFICVVPWIKKAKDSLVQAHSR